MDKSFTLPQNLCPSCFQETNGKYPCAICGYNGETVSEDIARLPIGAILQERYFIGRVLGQGGFGITYSAYDSRLARVSAIKEFFPSGIAARHTSEKSVFSTSNDLHGEYEHGKKKFLEEARVIANFNLPNVVSIRDVFEAHNTVYIVMPLYEGKTLLQILKAKEKISFEESIKILAPIMQALDRVHSNGMIHRDVSPDNIFITKTGEPVLLDFGAVKNALSQANPNSYSVGIVKKGYSAPEQYRNVELGPWTDVYSMSATLYRSVTGKLIPEPIDRLSGEAVTPPNVLGAGMLERAEAAVMQGLSLNGSERQQSMNDLLEGLGYRGEATSAPSGETYAQPLRQATPKTENKGKSLALSVAAVLCVVVAFGYLYETEPEKQAKPEPETPVEVAQQPKVEAEIPPKVEPAKKVKLTDEEFLELCKYGTAVEVQSAINDGADVKHKTNSEISHFEMSPIVAAAINTELKVIELLIENGVDVNVKTGDWSPLRVAIQENSNPHVAISLIRAGADIEGVYANGNSTALMSAAGDNPELRVTATLIECGAKVNVVDDHGTTPLMRAAECNPNAEIIEALIKAGANINARGAFGVTPLILAAKFNSNSDVILALMTAGADVNAKDEYGGTAYDYAKQNEEIKESEAYRILETKKTATQR